MKLQEYSTVSWITDFFPCTSMRALHSARVLWNVMGVKLDPALVTSEDDMNPGLITLELNDAIRCTRRKRIRQRVRVGLDLSAWNEVLGMRRSPIKYIEVI